MSIISDEVNYPIETASATGVKLWKNHYANIGWNIKLSFGN
ncbi:MAG: hypothetical protein OXE77_11310 [Flavobacteriaceae bacterium]|nr:hypothetical protein [Flavobacteriaceae bacterium]MCY4297737.1 hypothetical protein [Flavobacteriaceae bacterium]